MLYSQNPLVVLHSNDLAFWLNARFFSILNRKGEFLVVRRMYTRFRRNYVEKAYTPSEFKLRDIRKLVHRNGVSPATAYQELHGMFAADGVLEACADVLVWLRVACTARGRAGNHVGMPGVAQSFPLLLLPAAVLSNYAAAKVLSDLPGLHGPRVATAAHARDPTIAAVQQLAENVGGAGGR
jgi:hypothetical protein